MLLHFQVALGMALADILYTLWARKASQGRAIEAAFWATILIPVYGFVIIMYNRDSEYLVSACVGAFLGTFLAVKLDSKVKSG